MDIVVTVPKRGWPNWLSEGDLAGEPESGAEYFFFVPSRPPCQIGDRLYIIAHGRLRGYAPITRITRNEFGQWAIVRKGGAVPVTLKWDVVGFRGWRQRWWEYENELPFPDWRWRGIEVR